MNREQQNEKKIGELKNDVQWAARGWRDECDSTNNKFLITEAYRSYENQMIAWGKYQRGEIAAAAYPGTSLHQKWLAVDIYVISGTLSKIVSIAEQYGISRPLPTRDPCHFEFCHVQPPTPINPPPTPTLPQLRNALKWAKGIRASSILRAIKRLTGR